MDQWLDNRIRFQMNRSATDRGLYASWKNCKVGISNGMVRHNNSLAKFGRSSKRSIEITTDWYARWCFESISTRTKPTAQNQLRIWLRRTSPFTERVKDLRSTYLPCVKISSGSSTIRYVHVYWRRTLLWNNLPSVSDSCLSRWCYFDCFLLYFCFYLNTWLGYYLLWHQQNLSSEHGKASIVYKFELLYVHENVFLTKDIVSYLKVE